MNQEFFTFLPLEIIINVLSRLPVRTIIHCKCVCKSWLDLIETHEFAKSHLSKSVPALTVYERCKEMYKIFEFEDGPELERHELHYNPLTKFYLPQYRWMYGSADGFILLCDLSLSPHSLCVCNPITREYITLDSPQQLVDSEKQMFTFGFGASKTTGQHKVVGIIHDRFPTYHETHDKSVCHVYTLETGSWRRIIPPFVTPLEYYDNFTPAPGSLLFGNLHWLGYKSDSTPCISCFDLETEIFSTFSCVRPLSGSIGFQMSVVALGDFLCLCVTSYDDIVIWLMNEYGVEKSWTKEFVISKIPAFSDRCSGAIFPIKVFEDGDILMAWEDDFLFYHSKKNNTNQQLMFDWNYCIESFLYTPSFLSLTSFYKDEKVESEDNRETCSYQRRKMNQEFFTFLPSEIIINVLSRLPVRTIIYCKCVCKLWLDLIETHEFAKSHLSKSVPALTVYERCKEMYKIFEFEDGPELERHELHYNPLTKFYIPQYRWMYGSADGFILLCDLSLSPHSLCVCNPITREYINFDSPQELVDSEKQMFTFGFGASKTTGQHKVVGIINDRFRTYHETHVKSVCHVYTLETGSWRRITPPFVTPLEYYDSFTPAPGSLLFGNLHWLGYKSDSTPCISCFDLETEIFSTFSCVRPLSGSIGFQMSVVALGDFLCLCVSSYDDIVIWLMNEYGVEKSWTKEFVVSKFPAFSDRCSGAIFPIKVFEDGDILMAWEDDFLFYHSKKSNTNQQLMFHWNYCIESFLYTPSFLSLTSFYKGNVRSF